MTKINSSHTRITHMYKHIYTCVFPDEKREGESEQRKLWRNLNDHKFSLLDTVAFK